MGGRGFAGLHRNGARRRRQTGGTASTSGGSLGAPGWSGLGQKGEEEVGVKMGVVEGRGSGLVVGLKRGR